MCFILSCALFSFVVVVSLLPYYACFFFHCVYLNTWPETGIIGILSYETLNHN